MNRLVHFEICAKDLEKVSKFYTEAFSWQFQSWEGPEEYYLITTGQENKAGINGGMFKKDTDWPGVVNTIEVDSVDDALTKIIYAGGKIIREKHVIPGIGYQAYFKDPEGNLLGIHQPDPAAK